MTTIITIVVVALVFFVTVCVVGFMVWKRETEMRTDSIKAIEYNLEEMLYELTGNSSRDIRRRMNREESFRSEHNESWQEADYRTEKESFREAERKRKPEPKPEPFEQEEAECGVEKDCMQEESVDAEEKAEENVTVFEPVTVPYESFDRRKNGPLERDGKRGLKWKEVEETPAAKQEVPEPPNRHKAPEIPDEPEDFVAQEIPETPEPLKAPGSLEAPEAPEIPETPESLKTSEIPETPKLSGQSEPPDEGSKLSKLLKRHKKAKDKHEDEAETPEPVQYSSVEELLKDYISEPYSEPHTESQYSKEENIYDELDEKMGDVFDESYQETVIPGYNIGKSGKKYTAAELEALIKE